MRLKIRRLKDKKEHQLSNSRSKNKIRLRLIVKEKMIWRCPKEVPEAPQGLENSQERNPEKGPNLKGLKRIKMTKKK